MAEGKEWKMAIQSHYGLFESLVMPFGLTNTLVTFQDYINDILVLYLDRVYTTYLDNTLFYSDKFEEYQLDILLVFEACTKAALDLKPKKWVFHSQEAKYWGLMISMEGIKKDPEKTCAIHDC
jgi:hypothetical protein